jgi:hypothetical protein
MRIPCSVFLSAFVLLLPRVAGAESVGAEPVTDDIELADELLLECQIIDDREFRELRAADGSRLAPVSQLGGQAPDSDRDGISDALESAGGGDPLLDFPAFGADAGAPDLFVQADWIACDPIVEYCGPNNSLDQHRLSARGAEQLAAYFAPEVRLHVDNGVPAAPGDHTHGAWGGAHRVAPGQTACNPDTLGVRYGTFHRVLTYSISAGGNASLFGFCSTGNGVLIGVLAQELGHNFGIGHGGNPESYPANCKPHYRSPMNYAYTYNRGITQFSRGQFSANPLNPTRMDEQAGLGSTDAQVLAGLEGGVFRYQVRADGAVDWNRNGRIDPGTVRAATTWGWASCEQSATHTDAMLGPESEPVLAWLPDAAEPRLYLVTRRVDDGALETRFATRFDRCDYRQVESCTDFEPTPENPGQAIANSRAGVGVPALAGYTDPADTAHLMVVSLDTQGQLFAQTAALDAGEAVWTSPESVPAPLSAPASTAASAGGNVQGALVLVAMGDRLLLFGALDSGELHRWEYDIPTRVWRALGTEIWDDGAPMTLSCAGLAMTAGYQPDVPGPQLYMVIPTGPTCVLEFARLDQERSSWIRNGASAWLGEPPMSGGRPGLAYVPLDPAIPEDGRFYVAWRLFPAGAGMISMSQGNDPDPAATERRLVFESGVFIRNVWAGVMDGVALQYDARFDDNLRAAWVYRDQRVRFEPFADGIVDVDMYDQDDYQFILQYLACSLKGNC